MARLTESVVEDAALAWLNPALSAEALDDPLAALRDTLLPKLISGETQVKNVRRLSEEATA